MISSHIHLSVWINQTNKGIACISIIPILTGVFDWLIKVYVRLTNKISNISLLSTYMPSPTNINWIVQCEII